MACGEDSTYTATPALLELLPHGKRGEIAKAAGIGGRYHAERTQRRKCEQEHGGKGFPGRWASAFQSVHRAHQRGRQAQRKHSAALSPDVVQRIHKGGYSGGLVPENPCKRAEAPKAEEIDVQALEELDVARLLQALQDAPTQFSVITQLALFTGARRGEICGLRWSDVDLDAGTISIERTLQYIPGKGTVFTSPKNKNAPRRCIKMGADCVQLLQEYRKHQKAERFKIGSEWVRKVEIEGKTVENDLLFTKWNGAPIDPKTVTTRGSRAFWPRMTCRLYTSTVCGIPTPAC